jgi:acetyl-CoA acyltransferase
MGNKMAANPAWFSDENIGIAYGMGLTAEKVAQQWGSAARRRMPLPGVPPQGLRRDRRRPFQGRDSPFTVRDYKPDLATGEVRQRDRTPTDDEGARPTSPSRSWPSCARSSTPGSVTAGNASQMSDGAGAVMLVSEKVLKEHNLTPLARFAGFAVGGVAPEIMGIGPIVAIPKALQQAGIRKEDLDWIELNEAFAAQALAVVKELDLDRRRSTRSAAPSRSATRSVPPAPSARRRCCMACAAPAASTAWSACASAPAWVPPASSKASERTDRKRTP